MITKHKINMDLAIRNTLPQLSAVQGDRNSRAVEITMTASGVAWAPENVDTVFLRYRKIDGTGGCYDTLPDGTKAWSLEGNVLSVILAPQVLAVPEMVEAQAVLISGEQSVATFEFLIYVEEDLSAEIVEPENYINWAAWAQSELDDRLLQAKNSGEFDGATYMPQVDNYGILSWSNDRGAENPAPVSIINLLAYKLEQNMFLQLSGGTMSGALNMGGCRLTGLTAPLEESDAVTKSYCDRLFRKTTVTLPAALWSEDQITVQVTGIAEDNLVIVTPAPESFLDYQENGVRCTAQGAGQLTFACEIVPEKTLEVNVVAFLRGDAE